MRLWRADEARLIQMLLAVFSAFGVATIGLERHPSNSLVETGNFAGSSLALVYNLVLILSIAVTNYLTLTGLYLAFRSSLSLFHMLVFAEMIFGSLVSLLIIAAYCLRRRTSMKLAARLCRASASGAQLLASDDPALASAHACISGLAGLYFALTIGLLGLTLADYESVVIMLSSALREFVIIWLLVQYALVVRLLLGLFESVNAVLVALGQTTSYDLQLGQQHKNVESRAQEHRCSSSSARQLQVLSSVHELHCSLLQLTGDLVKFYELTVFGCIAYVVVCIVVFAYVSIAILVEKRSPFPLTLLERLYFVVCLICYVSAFVALARFVTKTVQEIDKTGVIVHQLIRHTLNKELLKELEDFSLYLLHAKVKFTAWGFFEIDGSLVQSIFGSITTYLVIVIQFQLGSASKSQVLDKTR